MCNAFRGHAREGARENPAPRSARGCCGSTKYAAAKAAATNASKCINRIGHLELM